VLITKKSHSHADAEFNKSVCHMVNEVSKILMAMKLNAFPCMIPICVGFDCTTFLPRLVSRASDDSVYQISGVLSSAIPDGCHSTLILVLQCTLQGACEAEKHARLQDELCES